jgi:primosomal protein N' (replication factor Y)
VRELIDVLDAEPFLSDDVVRLALWVAEYYACGAGEAIAAALPPRAWIESERFVQLVNDAPAFGERGLRRELLDALATGKPTRVATLAKRGSGVRAALLALERDGLIALTQPLRGTADAHRTLRTVHLTAQGHDADLSAPGVLGAKQKALLELLRGAPAGIGSADLVARGIGHQTLARLAAMGLVSIARRRVERDPFVHAVKTPSATPAAVAAVARPGQVHTLTAEQITALDRLVALAHAGRFATAVLHGVTGSGKTEVYLRLAEEVRRRRRGVLILVPEIALTPAVAAAFRNAFGESVAIQHSGLSDGERHDQWQRIRRGEVGLVVGTRSAIFAPLDRLGLIVVDEEHDSSYKQEESPRYNGRDVAIVRGQRAGALVVLGSATPSLESYHNAMTGRYERIVLGKRVFDRPLASVSIVDMREEYAAGGPDVVVSRALHGAIDARLAMREQALVLLNRRGFATAVFCRQCAGTLDCPNCSVSLVVHGEGHARRARCHYCNYTSRVPTKCPLCAAPYLEQAGFGTERVEAEIRRLCPTARVARLDRDSVRRKGALTALLSGFRDGDIDVLVGTQMIAKGHDFPKVTLVGVVSADVGLGMADFRASERTFQLLTQVAGRAGRGEQRGEAIVQTLNPGHYSIQLACRQDYPAFYDRELRFRRAMRYPPLVALINTVVRARTFSRAMDDAAGVVDQVRERDRELRVLGPAPAPLGRLRGEYRAQFLIKGTNRRKMLAALQAALTDRPDLARRTTVDVDPLSVM